MAIRTSCLWRDFEQCRYKAAVTWNGTLAFGAGRALFLGHAGDTSPHAHWAIQVAIGCDAPLRLEVGGGATVAAGVVVGSGVRHTLCADGARVALLFVEPLSDLGRAASAGVGEPGIAVLDATAVRAIRRAAGDPADRVLDVASAALVRRTTGMSLRPYVRWCRLRRATLAVVRGATLTEAAHEAGFADSAHLTRTMRAAFGVTPSAVLS